MKKLIVTLFIIMITLFGISFICGVITINNLIMQNREIKELKIEIKNYKGG